MPAASEEIKVESEELATALHSFLQVFQELARIIKETMNEKAKKLGAKYSPNVIFGIGEQNGKWVGSFDIGDYYYETDPYTTKGCAILELYGCLENLKLKIEQATNELKNELLKESE